uniref:Putative septation protein n=1 Tax=Podoviridae sp. ctZDN4 TaxID=2825258 RepID=A0A8S5U4B1_9CAUD|nr:MAG TPA: putative septation protein [Podoviridae sp. ctZDN4]
MAFTKNTTASNKNAPRVTMDMLHNLHAIVRSVRQVADNCLTFTLRLYGIDLYNMRLVESAKGTFISASATKGKDGKYYDNFRVYFDDAAQAAVEQAVRTAFEDTMSEVEV